MQETKLYVTHQTKRLAMQRQSIFLQKGRHCMFTPKPLQLTFLPYTHAKARYGLFQKAQQKA